jgi:archaellum component FlaC
MATEQERQAAQQNIDKALAGARKAKEDFDKAKAKIEAAKKKAEELKKKADKLKKDFEKLKNAYKAGGVRGGLAAVVASQVGTMRGKLIAYVQQRAFEALNKFVNECPNIDELKRIIALRNNLLKQITLVEGRVSKFQPIATKLNITVTTLQLAIQIIKQIPIPTAIIPPQAGGLGIPISTLNKFSDRINKLNTQLDKFGNEATAITSTVNRISPVLTNLKLKLQSIDIAVEGCLANNSSQELQDLVNTVQPLGNTGSENNAGGAIDPNYEYRGYKLEIIEDPNSPKIAPRRYAIAKDRRGIVVLRGEPSFSSSTDVLLDEIKFRIDNQLP